MATTELSAPAAAEPLQAPVAGRTTQPERYQPGAASGPRGSIFSTFRAPPTEDLGGNPGEIGNATEHRLLWMGDTSNHTMPADAPSVPQPGMVKPLATQQSPLHLAPGATPASHALYADADPAVKFPIGFAPISGFHGTPVQPIIDETPLPTLYVGGAPTVDDIQQGGVGDCYMLAVLAGVVQRDPRRLMSMMTPDGQGGATVRLWRRRDHERNLFESALPKSAPKYDYVQVSIHVSADLVADKGGGLRGAGVRAGAQPVSSAWWANVEPPQLAIHRSDLYPVARWVALFEKAWSRLAQDYGQYGGAREGKPIQTGASGYDVVDGGFENEVLPLIYGPEADRDAAQIKESTTQWSPLAASGASLLSANQGVIDQLCLVGNRPEVSSDQDVDAPNVTCATNTFEMARRLGPAVNGALDDPDFANLDPVHQAALQQVSAAWHLWNNTPPDVPGVTQRANALQMLVDTAGVTAAGPTNPLTAPGRSAVIQAAMDLMLDLRFDSDKFGTEQRNVITKHAYTVLGATFVDSAGALVPLAAAPQGQRAPMFPQIDTTRSTVRVRNPWHGGEPDRRGDHTPSHAEDGEPNGPTSDGIFTMSLDQFLRNFAKVSSAVFKRS